MISSEIKSRATIRWCRKLIHIFISFLSVYEGALGPQFDSNAAVLGQAQKKVSK